MFAPRPLAGAVRLPRRFGLRTLLALVTALCLYLGSYLALVQPQSIEGWGTAHPDVVLWFPTPTYGFAGRHLAHSLHQGRLVIPGFGRRST